MSIPNKDAIKEVILKELYQHREREYSLTAKEAYFNTSEYFEDILTEDEIYKKFKNSYSEWANAVQWARKYLIDDGLLLPENISGRNKWKLSVKGVEIGRKLYLEMMDGEDMYLDELEVLIKNDLDKLEEEIDIEYKEGKIKEILSSKYERDLKLRRKVIELHGTTCQVCQFNFHKIYGELGKDFIEVHHLIPISNFKEEHNVNPKTEMAVLCANCHRMMHRNRNTILTISELKEIFKN